MDGVVYALTHQPTAQAMSLRILRRARVDIQYGHVGINQDGTGSPRCIPPAPSTADNRHPLATQDIE